MATPVVKLAASFMVVTSVAGGGGLVGGVVVDDELSFLQDITLINTTKRIKKLQAVILRIFKGIIVIMKVIKYCFFWLSANKFIHPLSLKFKNREHMNLVPGLF